jgi:hypothetical protein
MPTHVISANGLTADANTGNIDLDFKAKKIIITDAQLKALPTSPFELIPAPGVGKYVLLHSLSYRSVIVGKYLSSTGTDLDGNSDIVTTYGANLINLSEVLLAPSYLGAGAEGSDNVYFVQRGYMTTASSSSAFSASAIENKSVCFSSDSQDGFNYTGGNVANKFEVTVCYTIVDL